VASKRKPFLQNPQNGKPGGLFFGQTVHVFPASSSSSDEDSISNFSGNRSVTSFEDVAPNARDSTKKKPSHVKRARARGRGLLGVLGAEGVQKTILGIP